MEITGAVGWRTLPATLSPVLFEGRGGEGRERFLSDLCSSVLVTPFSRKGFGQQTSKERLQHWQ